MQGSFGGGLSRLRQLVQDIGCLVDPAALAAGVGKDLLQRLPEAQRRDLQGKEAASGGDEAASRTADYFLDCLPPELGRDLVYLRMADHYVEAFTTSGSTLVLMRFADAVAALEGAGGLRVHRSYWVAKKHVTGTARRNARTTLRLTGGHEAPVSRGYLPAVRRAGLM